MLFLELLSKSVLKFRGNSKQIIKMAVLDLSDICKEVNIGMHAQRKTGTLVGRGPLMWFSLTLCIKQIITSGTSGHLWICLAASCNPPGMLQPFCITILLKNFIPRLSLLKGDFFCVNLLLSGPICHYKEEFDSVIIARALRKEWCVDIRSSLSLVFFTRLSKPSSLDVFSRAMHPVSHLWRAFAG